MQIQGSLWFRQGCSCSKLPKIASVHLSGQSVPDTLEDVLYGFPSGLEDEKEQKQDRSQGYRRDMVPFRVFFAKDETVSVPDILIVAVELVQVVLFMGDFSIFYHLQVDSFFLLSETSVYLFPIQKEVFIQKCLSDHRFANAQARSGKILILLPGRIEICESHAQP